MDHGAAKTEKLNDCLLGLPENLCIRPCENSRCGYGIWALKSIPSKTVFGPYNGSFIDNAEEKTNGGFQWKMERDKVEVILDGSDEGGSSWLRYVNYACTKDEQNLAAVQHESQVYYVVIETIVANTQLLVWYHERIFQRGSNNKEKSAHPKILQMLDGRERDMQNEGFSKMSQQSKSPVLGWPTAVVPKCIVTPVPALENKFKVQTYHQLDTIEKSDLVKTAESAFYPPPETFSTPMKPYECNVCHKSCATEESLNKHQRNHTEKTPYQCSICEKVFKTSRYLTVHQITHSTEKLYECNVCQRHFKYLGTLRTHKLRHSGERPFQCAICIMRFYDSSSLKRHSQIHTGEKPKECKICTARFRNSYSLQRHITTHRNVDAKEMPYEYQVILTNMESVRRAKLQECEICHKTYSHRGNLLSHMRNHTGERPYECAVCKKCFKLPNHLHRHLRSHSTNRPFECDICKMSFKTLWALKTHKLKHAGEKQFKCNVCGKSFYDGRCLRRHNKMHTGDMAYECQICHKKFIESGRLKDHVTIHTGEKPYECQVCHARFRQRNGLLGHKRIHTGEKPYECKICHKKFRFTSPLRIHLKVHTKKVYDCEICHNSCTKGRVECCKTTTIQT